jgi:hypothetical protein
MRLDEARAETDELKAQVVSNRVMELDDMILSLQWLTHNELNSDQYGSVGAQLKESIALQAIHVLYIEDYTARNRKWSI